MLNYPVVMKQVGLVIISGLIALIAWMLIATITPIGNYLRQQRAQFVRSNFESRHIYASNIVYILIAFGLLFFVLPISYNINDAALYGFIFAMVIEGVFGFSNYVTVNHYSVKLLIAGLITGCVIITGMSVLMFWLSEFIFID